jgi:hypothetical protein
MEKEIEDDENPKDERTKRLLKKKERSKGKDT